MVNYVLNIEDLLERRVNDGSVYPLTSLHLLVSIVV